MNSVLKRWSGLIFCILTLTLLAPPMAQAQAFWPFGKLDTDEDGIDDDLEAQLIKQYAPTYRFDSSESFWPSSVTWHVQHSLLERVKSGKNSALYTEAEMAANPGLALLGHLKDAGSDYSPRYRASSAEYYPVLSDYRLDINNNSRQGEGYGESADFMSSKGVYAKVQSVTPPIGYDGGSVTSSEQQLYLIQYWQFFSYDDAPTAGDHEADWVFLDVYCKTTAPYELVALVYHHHGDGNCAPGIHTENLSLDNGHPICYIEDDSHEWYMNPKPNGDCGITAKARGNGVTYQVKDVINLGERFAPISRPTDTPAIALERRLALFYNGRWGEYGDAFADPPPGPAFQNRSKASGVWTVSRPLWVGYVNANYSPIPNFEPYTSATPGYGTRYYPFLNMNDALADGANVDGVQIGIKDHGVVRISPGNYTVPANNGNLRRITQPMRLEANGTGIVRLQKSN